MKTIRAQPLKDGQWSLQATQQFVMVLNDESESAMPYRGVICQGRDGKWTAFNCMAGEHPERLGRFATEAAAMHSLSPWLKSV